MKRMIFTAAAMVCAFALSGANTGRDIPSFAARAPMFKIIAPNTIQVKYDGASSSSTTAKDNKWLGVEFSYTARKAAKNEFRFLDDVRVVGTVIMASETPAGRPAFAVFTGESHLWHIALDGKARKIMMLVPPQIVNRYLPQKMTLSKAMVLARIQIFDAKGLPLAVEYATLNKTGSVKPEDVMVDFQRIDSDPKIGFRVKNALLPKSRTPWVNYDYYTYDLEKDMLLNPENSGAGNSSVAEQSTSDGN